MDRIKSRDATGGDDANCEIYCEMECAELKLVWKEETSEVRERQVRFWRGFFAITHLCITPSDINKITSPLRSHPAIFPTFYLESGGRAATIWTGP